jgi:hypothetical protein
LKPELVTQFGVYVDEMENYREISLALLHHIKTTRNWEVKIDPFTYNKKLVELIDFRCVNITNIPLNAIDTDSLFCVFVLGNVVYAFYYLKYFEKLDKMISYVQNMFDGKFIFRDEDTFLIFLNAVMELRTGLDKLYGRGNPRVVKELSTVKFGLNYVEITPRFWEINKNNVFYYKAMVFLYNFKKKYRPVKREKKETRTLLLEELKRIKSIRIMVKEIDTFFKKMGFINLNINDLNKFNYFFVTRRAKQKLQELSDEDEDILMKEVYLKQEDDIFEGIWSKLKSEEKVDFQSKFNGVYKLALEVIENPVDFSLETLDTIIRRLQFTLQDFIVARSEFI